MTKLKGVFCNSDGQISITLIMLFFIINALVLINACLHSPLIGYDMGSHSKNVEYLSKLSWPSNLESSEFFSPPLPYAIPALAFALIGNMWWAIKIGQLCNVLLSLGTTYFLLKICETVLPGQTRVKVFSLGLLGMVPVYYKTFSQMRGEPYLVFLSLLTAFLTYRIFIFKELTIRNTILLGLSMGSLALARQWGFLVFPAIFICVFTMAVADADNRTKMLKVIFYATVISALIGGGFYIYMLSQYGSILAFNRTPVFKKNDTVFFFDISGDGKLFLDPIRPNFQRQVFPILYAETWGDYWGYFSVFLIDSRTNTYVKGRSFEYEMMEKKLSKWAFSNRFKFNSYLGRINLVSIVPTFILLLGAIYGVYSFILSLRSPPDPINVLLGLSSNIVTGTLIGYLWFLSYARTGGAGDTIKATYILQIFPFLALLGGALLINIQNKYLIYFLAFVLVIISIHNLPAMFTHVIELPWQGPLLWNFPGR